jgi:hypothetical protein
MSAPTKARTSWIWFVIGLVLVGGIAVFVTLTIVNSGAVPTPRPTSSSAQVTVIDSPTGCLGGETRDSRMLVSAVSQAAQDSDGAVEVAASFVRWIQRFPYPSADEALDVEASVLSSESFTNDLVQYLADQPDLSGGIVAPGESYWMSTVPGVWHVESAAADRVEVTIGTGFVIDGALSPTLRSSITITLVWEGSGWKVAEADGTRTTEELYSIGERFDGGC